MKALNASLALAAICFAVPGAAQTIIAPNSGVVDLGGPGAGALANTFSQAGLSTGYTPGVTDFDAYLATNPMHSYIFAGNEWFSSAGTNAATVTYNFGSAMGIDRLALWNEEAAGIGQLALSSSLDGITFTSLGTFTPTDHSLNTDYLADVFSFAATNAQYVRFTMTGCPQPKGSYQACAIGEVAFRSAVIGGVVPEPSAWALLILGFGAVGAGMRRRKMSFSYA